MAVGIISPGRKQEEQKRSPLEDILQIAQIAKAGTDIYGTLKGSAKAATDLESSAQEKKLKALKESGGVTPGDLDELGKSYQAVPVEDAEFTKKMIDPTTLSFTDQVIGFKRRPTELSPEAQVMLGLQTEKAKKELAKSPEGEVTAATFAERTRKSSQGIDDLLAKGFDPTSFSSSIMERIPEIAKPGPNKQFEQHKRNFVNSVLRRESGAAISASEFENANKQYFPVAGDTPEVIEQKRQNRLDAIAGLETAAGESLGKVQKKRSSMGSAPIEKAPANMSFEDFKKWKASQK